MSDLVGVCLSLIFGMLLGLFFFGGLWWTIQKAMDSNQAALWFIGSLLVRTAVVMTGFYFVSQHQWPRFVACLVGFLLARSATVKWLAIRSDAPQTKLASESHHEA